MSAACNNLQGSLTTVSLIENKDCSAAPIVQNLKVTVAAAIGDGTISLALDSASVNPVYTAASRQTLVADTVLTIGTTQVVVLAASNGDSSYNLSTTGQIINVKPLKAAIALNAVTTSYLALRICLKSSNIATDTTSVDNTTNCSGSLYTNINVGFSKTMELMGYVATKDFSYHVLATVGERLGTFFFAVNYDDGAFVIGQVQVTAANITGSEVKNILNFSIKGQIQNIDYNYGTYVATALDLTTLNNRRALFGFAPTTKVLVNPLA